MENKKLLNRYKIKLSVFFALTIMFSIYLIQTFFLWIQFLSKNYEIKWELEKKLEVIENILKNKDLFYQKISSNDKTLETIILKNLENSTIYEENDKIIDFWKEIDIESDWIINLPWEKYLVKKININNLNYKIILFSNNPFNIRFLIKELLFYWIILSPFFIIFYLIWYFIIWKYFKIINQTIESLENFTSNINHELKTPISEIISTLSLTKELWNYKEASEISLKSSLKLNKVIDSIVWIANLWDLSYQKERIDVEKEINEIINSYQKEINKKKLKIKLNFTNNKILKKINKEHFNLCIKNLLSNAIKYSNKSWIIEIYFEKWVLQIKDYWIWIDKDNIWKIFSRYFRENYIENEWLGIWLNLVKKIVELNKWKIDIESEKWKYSNFIINFN